MLEIQDVLQSLKVSKSKVAQKNLCKTLLCSLEASVHDIPCASSNTDRFSFDIGELICQYLIETKDIQIMSTITRGIADCAYSFVVARNNAVVVSCLDIILKALSMLVHDKSIAKKMEVLVIALVQSTFQLLLKHPEALPEENLFCKVLHCQSEALRVLQQTIKLEMDILPDGISSNSFNVLRAYIGKFFRFVLSCYPEACEGNRQFIVDLLAMRVTTQMAINIMIDCYSIQHTQILPSTSEILATLLRTYADTMDSISPQLSYVHKLLWFTLNSIDVLLDNQKCVASTLYAIKSLFDKCGRCMWVTGVAARLSLLLLRMQSVYDYALVLEAINHGLLWCQTSKMYFPEIHLVEFSLVCVSSTCSKSRKTLGSIKYAVQHYRQNMDSLPLVDNELVNADGPYKLTFSVAQLMVLEPSTRKLTLENDAADLFENGNLIKCLGLPLFQCWWYCIWQNDSQDAKLIALQATPTIQEGKDLVASCVLPCLSYFLSDAVHGVIIHKTFHIFVICAAQNAFAVQAGVNLALIMLNDSKYASIGLRLLLSMWKENTRIFPRLFDSLSNNTISSKDDFRISRIATVLEICKFNNEAGASLIKVIQECLSDDNPAVFSLALDCITILCSFGTMDFPKARKFVDRQLKFQERNSQHKLRTIAYCQFLGSGGASLSNKKRCLVVAQLELHTKSKTSEVRRVAWDALSRFDLQVLGFERSMDPECDFVVNDEKINFNKQRLVECFRGEPTKEIHNAIKHLIIRVVAHESNTSQYLVQTGEFNGQCLFLVVKKQIQSKLERWMQNSALFDNINCAETSAISKMLRSSIYFSQNPNYRVDQRENSISNFIGSIPMSCNDAVDHVAFSCPVDSTSWHVNELMHAWIIFAKSFVMNECAPLFFVQKVLQFELDSLKSRQLEIVFDSKLLLFCQKFSAFLYVAPEYLSPWAKAIIDSMFVDAENVILQLSTQLNTESETHICNMLEAKGNCLRFTCSSINALLNQVSIAATWLEQWGCVATCGNNKRILTALTNFYGNCVFALTQQFAHSILSHTTRNSCHVLANTICGSLWTFTESDIDKHNIQATASKLLFSLLKGEMIDFHNVSDDNMTKCLKSVLQLFSYCINVFCLCNDENSAVRTLQSVKLISLRFPKAAATSYVYGVESCLNYRNAPLQQLKDDIPVMCQLFKRYPECFVALSYLMRTLRNYGIDGPYSEVTNFLINSVKCKEPIESPLHCIAALTGLVNMLGLNIDLPVEINLNHGLIGTVVNRHDTDTILDALLTAGTSSNIAIKNYCMRILSMLQAFSNVNLGHTLTISENAKRLAVSKDTITFQLFSILNSIDKTSSDLGVSSMLTALSSAKAETLPSNLIGILLFRLVSHFKKSETVLQACVQFACCHGTIANAGLHFLVAHTLVSRLQSYSTTTLKCFSDVFSVKHYSSVKQIFQNVATVLFENVFINEDACHLALMNLNHSIEILGDSDRIARINDLWWDICAHQMYSLLPDFTTLEGGRKIVVVRLLQNLCSTMYAMDNEKFTLWNKCFTGCNGIYGRFAVISDSLVSEVGVYIRRNCLSAMRHNKIANCCTLFKEIGQMLKPRIELSSPDDRFVILDSFLAAVFQVANTAPTSSLIGDTTRALMMMLSCCQCWSPLPSFCSTDSDKLTDFSLINFPGCIYDLYALWTTAHEDSEHLLSHLVNSLMRVRDQIFNSAQCQLKVRESALLKTLDHSIHLLLKISSASNTVALEINQKMMHV